MKDAKIHIAILFSAVVLFQAGTSLGHVFVHHHEHGCIDHGHGHYHAQKYDCDSSFFFRTLAFFDEIEPLELPVFITYSTQFQNHYEFFPKKLTAEHFLRGPPPLL